MTARPEADSEIVDYEDDALVWSWNSQRCLWADAEPLLECLEWSPFLPKVE